jgi:hypothetical protein
MLNPKRMLSRIGTASVLLMMPVLAAFAQTGAIDVLAAKRFGMPVISSGDNVPDFEPMDDRMDLLLIALHKNIGLSEFGAKMGFNRAKIDKLLRFLEEKNFAHRVGGRYKPAVFIADAEDGRRLFEYALPISKEIVKAIGESLPSILEQFSRTDMSRGRRFESWAFFILSDVLLDNWQIDRVERDFLKTKSRPLRNGKNYYTAFLEKNAKNEPFGIYGNQVGAPGVYGNNRWRVEATTTGNRISASDGVVLEKMAEDFSPRLLGILEGTRPYAEKVFVDSGYSKEVAFNEFYIWWYHFIYTRATDLMAEAGLLSVPADGNFLYQMTQN